MVSGSTFDTGQWYYIIIYQRFSSTGTSSGSYIQFYLPPNVQISPSFSAGNDCRFGSTYNSCDVAFEQTATYLKITIKATGSYAVSNPNPFPYNSRIYLYIRNILFPKAATDRQIYPIYMTLYKSDVVNPTYYRKAMFLGA